MDVPAPNRTAHNHCRSGFRRADVRLGRLAIMAGRESEVSLLLNGLGRGQIKRELKLVFRPERPRCSNAATPARPQTPRGARGYRAVPAARNSAAGATPDPVPRIAAAARSRQIRRNARLRCRSSSRIVSHSFFDPTVFRSVGRPRSSRFRGCSGFDPWSECSVARRGWWLPR